MTDLGTLGRKKARQVTTIDKTEHYYDLEAKRNNTAAYRDQLRTLLGRAKDVKDVLQIREQLNRVQSELDSLDGSINRLNGEIAKSRLELTIRKQRVLGPLGYVGYGIVWVIEKLFFIQQ